MTENDWTPGPGWHRHVGGEIQGEHIIYRPGSGGSYYWVRDAPLPTDQHTVIAVWWKHEFDERSDRSVLWLIAGMWTDASGFGVTREELYEHMSGFEVLSKPVTR